MKLFSPARAALGVAAVALATGCSGASSTAPAAGNAAQAVQRAARPAPLGSGAPWLRVGVATPKRSRIVRGAQTVLVSETFANGTTSAHDWIHKDKDRACLTAGTAKSTGSLPPCRKLAPQDPPGQGALQLTTDAGDALGWVAWHKPLPTANGLEIEYTLYAFDGSSPGADGSLVFLTGGANLAPWQVASAGGDLGYLNGYGPTGLDFAYLGIGFDEYGNFSAYLPGGPGYIPETVAVGGAYSIGYAYLGGVTNGSGEPASLPFNLDDPSSPTRPATAPTIYISLNAAGLLEVAIDIHDGNGPVTYLSENVVGVAGQPAVPASVYVGFIGSTGGLWNRHQIGNLTISTLQ